MLIPADRKELLAAIRKMVRAELDDSAQRHPAGRQILYTPVQAGAMLGVSRGSIDILVNSGLLRPRRWGRKALIPYGLFIGKGFISAHLAHPRPAAHAARHPGRLRP